MLACFQAEAANAGIISTTGAIDVLASPPPSVKLGDLRSDTELFTFQESSNLTLSQDVSVDITTAGTYQSKSSLTPGTISAGTEVDSYFLHSNPVHQPQVYVGSITFSSPILGVIVLSAGLDKTDSLLGAPGTEYPTGNVGRGLELSPTEDYVTLSSDLKTLSVHFTTHDDIDEVRILTAAVPEPASLILAVPALLALPLLRRFIRRTKTDCP
jgi:hypothetical protein